MTGEIRFDVDELRRYAAALLTAGGFRPAEAEQTADVLVWANARGVDSHGVLRIPRYVEMVELGLINPASDIVVEERKGAITRLEASRAPGAAAMIAAMREAVGQARDAGVSWCAVRNITHAGAVGYYALQAAREGFVGIVMTASGPLMAYHGSRSSAVSTNPIAIAVPSEHDPIVLDMSTANVALGKVMAARDAGQTIPPDWGVDAEGNPTTDPKKVETLTPLGGPKGSGLSLMIEILTSVLVANPVIAPALEKSGGGTMNGLAVAVQVGAFGALDHFRAEVERLATALRGVPRAADTAKILMPGERGFATAAARETSGIPLPAGTVTRLAKLAEKLGVSPPQTRAGP
ncbi:Ldh family oxidoreductase [Bradyrhizobium jicamae]|uniref:Ldh family oxidoreductase n=1 Tax=Bradyrhizobium jicamae TaxID=280332 RepID=UPI001BAA8AA2|nr:Ldh family oxidoreductase [Bradyrhizobium jicamae]MBR0757747.1 Ldh family oxidoreductase [Bradyrhizobium jicamae]